MSISSIGPATAVHADRLSPVPAPTATHGSENFAAAQSADAAKLAQLPTPRTWSSSVEEAAFNMEMTRRRSVETAKPGGPNKPARVGDFRFVMRMQILRRIYSVMRGPLAERELESLSDRLVEALRMGDAMEPLLNDGEVTAVFIALRDAQQRLLREGGNELAREKVELELKRVWRSHRGRILSEIKIAGSIADFSGKISERDQLRRIYYDDIVADAPLRETFERLLQAFGAKRMPRALRALRNAIIEDISAPISLADLARLEQGRRNLGELVKINSLGMDAADLGKRLDAPSLKSINGIFEFVRSVLRYIESPGGGMRFAALCEAAVGKDRKDSVYVQGQLRVFLRDKLPLTIWTDMATRETLTSVRYTMAAAAAT
jgi:hypothetical protein